MNEPKPNGTNREHLVYWIVRFVVSLRKLHLGQGLDKDLNAKDTRRILIMAQRAQLNELVDQLIAYDQQHPPAAPQTLSDAGATPEGD